MNTNTIEEKFILGGHEFTSRFILGSRKNFLWSWSKACVEKAGAPDHHSGSAPGQ